MSILERPTRRVDKFDDGPVRASGEWLPENGREYYIHSHLSDETGDADALADSHHSDDEVFELVREMSKVSNDTAAIVATLAAGRGSVGVMEPVDRYIVGDDGRVLRVDRHGEKAIATESSKDSTN